MWERAKLVSASDVVPVNDEAHAQRLLRELRPDMSPDERDALARQLATGQAMLVRDDDFELLDPHPPRPSDEPYEPLTPDPPPAPEEIHTWFEATLVDLHGVPLAGVEVRWSCDGEQRTAVTTGEGVVRLEEATARSATVSIADTDTLRTALEAAWARPSEASPLTAEDGVQVVLYRDDLVGPIMLSSEKPRTLSLQPLVVLGRLLGMFFPTDGDFLLPISLPAIEELKALYDRCEPKRVLIVGHTDTSDQAAYNEGLSRVRAEAVRAYLTDDVDAWLARYAAAVGRWGTHEDYLMLTALPDWPAREPGYDPILWFQETRGLALDGDAGEETRRALITEYMARDGTTLPAGTAVDVHGCGEAYPLDETGEEIDDAPVDGMDDPIDRRVEVFFLGDSLGVLPPTTDPTAYLTWRRRADVAYEQVFGAHAVELALREEDGSPIPGARYSVRLQSGVVIDGKLDDAGNARIDRLPEGEVDVDFPDLEDGAVVTDEGPLEGTA